MFRHLSCLKKHLSTAKQKNIQITKNLNHSNYLVPWGGKLSMASAGKLEKEKREKRKKNDAKRRSLEHQLEREMECFLLQLY